MRLIGPLPDIAQLQQCSYNLLHLLRPRRTCHQRRPQACHPQSIFYRNNFALGPDDDFNGSCNQ